MPLSKRGNVTLSAERSKVSRSWVCLQRSTDVVFDAACREALASFDKLRMSGFFHSRKPPFARWARHDGHELVVSGTGGSALRDASAPQDERKSGRRVQIRRSRLRQWSPKVEARFLAALSATCNVKAACREVGMAFSSAYAHRKRWPGFARAWAEALEVGYGRLESALITNARFYLDPHEEQLPDELLTGMSVAHAIAIARMNWAKARG